VELVVVKVAFSQERAPEVEEEGVEERLRRGSSSRMMVMVEFQCNLVKFLLVGVYQFWVEVYRLQTEVFQLVEASLA
jgi:hypothetical protein